MYIKTFFTQLLISINMSMIHRLQKKLFTLCGTRICLFIVIQTFW